MCINLFQYAKVKLSGTKLSSMKLFDAKLFDVKLFNGKWSNTNLPNAKLYDAKLSSAKSCGMKYFGMRLPFGKCSGRIHEMLCHPQWNFLVRSFKRKAFLHNHSKHDVAILKKCSSVK